MSRINELINSPFSLILKARAPEPLSKEGARLEGWMQALEPLPSFETHRGADFRRAGQKADP